MIIQSASRLPPSNTSPCIVHDNLVKSASENPIGHRPPPPPIRKLKSSLKISRPDPPTRSKSDIFLTSPEKNVRFAIELTTVKRFDKNAEPISISNENSPTISPVDNYTSADDIQLFNNEDCWFNDSSVVSNLLKNEKKFRYMNSLNNMFKLDLYDSEDEDDIDKRNSEQPGYDYTYDSLIPKKNGSHNKSETSSATSSLASQATSICDWKLHGTDLTPLKPAPPLFTKTSSPSDLQDQLTRYLHGQNIKLHSLVQSDQDSSKIIGLIYVNNLSFEKYLEIKFTFNSWKDIHYVSANFNKTINSNVDEFKFTIDLNSLKYILLIKKIITVEDKTNSCPLNIELCCRYDVHNETFYDNNNGKNYHLFMSTFKKGQETEGKKEIPVVMESALQKNTTTPSKNVKSKFISSNSNLSRFSPQSRKFSEDTDYYNTSPLKHLYHNDTTTFVKPKRLNVVLEKAYDTTPSPPPLADNTKIDNVIENANTAPVVSNNIGVPPLGPQHQSLYSGSSSYSSSSSSISSSLSFASSNNSSSNSSSSASYSFPLTELDNFDYANLYEPNDSFTTTNLLNHSLSTMVPLPDTSTSSFFGDFGNGINNNDNNNNNNNTIINNIATSVDDSYEDKQSVITDTTMDDNNKTSTLNNSTDTLIKPSKENGAHKGSRLPTNGVGSPTSSQDQTSTNLNGHSNENIESKYINYQSLLDSHRFYNHSSSQNPQSTSSANIASLPGVSQTPDVLDYEDEDIDSTKMVEVLSDNAFSSHFYLNEGDKSACLSNDPLIGHHENNNPFINTFSSSPPILSHEVNRWRL